MAPPKRVKASCGRCGVEKPGAELRWRDGGIVCDACLDDPPGRVRLHSQFADVLVDADVAARLPAPSPWNVLVLWDGEQAPLLGETVRLRPADLDDWKVIAVEDDVPVELVGVARAVPATRTLVVVTLCEADEEVAA